MVLCDFVWCYADGVVCCGVLRCGLVWCGLGVLWCGVRAMLCCAVLWSGGLVWCSVACSGVVSCEVRVASRNGKLSGKAGM